MTRKSFVGLATFILIAFGVPWAGWWLVREERLSLWLVPLLSHLTAVMHLCHQRRLPPLTVLVVNKETGLPGAGLVTLEALGRDRERVVGYSWYQLLPPTAADLNRLCLPIPKRRGPRSA